MTENYGSMEHRKKSFRNNENLEQQFHPLREELDNAGPINDRTSELSLEGVSKAEAIASTWSKRSIIVAYLGYVSIVVMIIHKSRSVCIHLLNVCVCGMIKLTQCLLF